MTGPEPELHGFARMVGNGVGLPGLGWISTALWTYCPVNIHV